MEEVLYVLGVGGGGCADFLPHPVCEKSKKPSLDEIQFLFLATKCKGAAKESINASN